MATDDQGKPEKLAEQIARQIEQDISASGWPVGEVMGGEAELLARYGVSRAVLREAVRLLEHNRVARMRRGPGGGLVVEAPAASVAASAIATHFAFTGVKSEEIAEARSSIEQATARLAAERISEQGIAALRELLEQEQQDSVRDHPFHIAVAEATGNAALVIFVAALGREMARRAGLAVRDARFVADDAKQIRSAHSAIADAIIAGDAARAERHMTKHLSAGLDWLRRDAPSRGKRSKPDWRIDPQAGSAKLAARVAEAVKDDVVAEGRVVGDVVASEPELIERYGVSRAVFREAVRILEHNGVALMRRGPGGGLVVGEPDSSRVLDVVGNYLLYAGLDRDVIYDARCAVELTAVELAAGRVDEAGVAALQASLDAERSAGEHGREQAGEFHVVMAGISGNHALSFFVRILARLTNLLVPEPDAYPPATSELVEHVHERIAEAIIAQDPSLARHRMLRHLQAVAPWIGLEQRRSRAA